MDKISIKSLLPEDLKTKFAVLDLPAFRASQVLDWVYKKMSADFSTMSNIPRPLQQLLSEHFYISKLDTVKVARSRDATEKFLFALSDGKFIESVYIPAATRSTICLSSQVGCALACQFCASGEAGFERNLTVDEIVDQIIAVEKQYGRISNVVFMGMGEPLLNYENVLMAIRIINSPQALNIGSRKITISTAGIVPAIKRLPEEGMQFELSVSLHAAREALRSTLMPINKKYPLKLLIDTCRAYTNETKRLVTFEYLLLNKINDSLEEAQRLAHILKGFDCKVNLIIYNPLDKAKFRGPQPEAVAAFMAILKQNRIKATQRLSRGRDIEAACGQLRQRFLPPITA